MKQIKICLGIDASLPESRLSAISEKNYQKYFKQFASSLYKWEFVPFVLNLPGHILEWLESRHPEFVSFLDKMLSRKQVELLGGGFYEPIFPFIPLPDRVAQIELSTNFISSRFGKRPRGCSITGSTWEPSLIGCLQSCGMSYTFLDKLLIQSADSENITCKTPVVSEYMGKSLIVFPRDLQILTDDITPQEFLDRIYENIDENESTLLTAFIPITATKHFFVAEKGKQSWLEEFFDLIANQPESITLTLPSTYIKNYSDFPVCYIPQGASPNVNKWSSNNPSENISFSDCARNSVRRFFLRYPEAHDIYSRMLYVNTLVNQIRGDKERKRDAQLKVLKAQYCESYWYTGMNGIINKNIRSIAYKNLLEAEKITRKTNKLVPSVTSFDFDGDGLKEYLCLYQSLNIFLHPRSGVIFELDDLTHMWNYANIGIRRSISGIPEENSLHKMFVDHLIPVENITQFLASGDGYCDSVFQKLVYKEVSFDRTKHEVTLRAVGFFGAFSQPVSLKKKFSFRKEGVQVQYILKNESPIHLSAVFASELNIALPGDFPEGQPITFVTSNSKNVSALVEQNISDVSCVQLLDAVNSMLFLIENNENAHVHVYPRSVTVFDGEKTSYSFEGVGLYLYWPIELSSNYEMEKTIFFSMEKLVPPSKQN